MTPSLRPPTSGWMIAACLTAMGAFYLSTLSPSALVLPMLLLFSVVCPLRMKHDSGSIWGLRLLIYVGCAALGRSTDGNVFYADRQAFVTAGLMAGGELILQLFREPLPGSRFNGWIVSLSGIIFLIACNTRREHIWFAAPLYMLFLLLCLPDLRPRAAAVSGSGSVSGSGENGGSRPSFISLSGVKRVAILCLSVAVGTAFHGTLVAHQSELMALGARLLSEQEGGGNGDSGGVSEAPKLSSSLGGDLSTTRLLRISGTLSDPHLRGAAFDQYRRGEWGPALSRRHIDSALPNETNEEDENKQSRPRAKTDAKITLLRDSRGLMFAPLSAWALLPAEGQSFNWNRFRGPLLTEDPAPVDMFVINSKKEFYGFQVEQGPLAVRPDVKSNAVPDPAKAMRDLLEVPSEIDPKVVQLARQITSGPLSQAEKAARLVDYLFTHNRYSLEFTRTNQDPVSDFVLNKKAAHCQYFASALTMLLRAAGIPARYVTGYYAHEAAPDGTTVVRGRDAHAWSEAYIDKLGWVTLDATPPGGRADPRVNELTWGQKTLEKAQDGFARLRAWFAGLTQLQIGEILAGILTLWGLERWRQARQLAKKRVPGPVPPAELLPLARRFERVLQKRGIALKQNRPWSESLPAELAAEREWVDGYNRIRFDENGQAHLQSLEAELKKLEKSKG